MDNKVIPLIMLWFLINNMNFITTSSLGCDTIAKGTINSNFKGLTMKFTYSSCAHLHLYSERGTWLSVWELLVFWECASPWQQPGQEGIQGTSVSWKCKGWRVSNSHYFYSILLSDRFPQRNKEFFISDLINFCSQLWLLLKSCTCHLYVRARIKKTETSVSIPVSGPPETSR